MNGTPCKKLYCGTFIFSWIFMWHIHFFMRFKWYSQSEVFFFFFSFFSLFILASNCVSLGKIKFWLAFLIEMKCYIASNTTHRLYAQKHWSKHSCEKNSCQSLPLIPPWRKKSFTQQVGSSQSTEEIHFIEIILNILNCVGM